MKLLIEMSFIKILLIIDKKSIDFNNAKDED